MASGPQAGRRPGERGVKMMMETGRRAREFGGLPGGGEPPELRVNFDPPLDPVRGGRIRWTPSACQVPHPHALMKDATWWPSRAAVGREVVLGRASRTSTASSQAAGPGLLRRCRSARGRHPTHRRHRVGSRLLKSLLGLRKNRRGDAETGGRGERNRQALSSGRRLSFFVIRASSARILVG